VSHCGWQRLLLSSWFGSVPQSLAYTSLRFMAERLPMVASNDGISTFPVSMSRVRHSHARSSHLAKFYYWGRGVFAKTRVDDSTCCERS
jgi:hypothetical protein